jgi:hypothetical protein
LQLVGRHGECDLSAFLLGEGYCLGTLITPGGHDKPITQSAELESSWRMWGFLVLSRPRSDLPPVQAQSIGDNTGISAISCVSRS